MAHLFRSNKNSGPAPSSSTSAGKAKAPPDATSTRSAAEKALQKKERRKELEKQKLSKNGEALIVFIESSADIKVSDATVRLEAFEFLASYNWAPSKKPTIYVPGKLNISAVDFYFVTNKDRISCKMEPTNPSNPAPSGSRPSLRQPESKTQSSRFLHAVL